jgi:hypothetical protein
MNVAAVNGIVRWPVLSGSIPRTPQITSGEWNLASGESPDVCRVPKIAFVAWAMKFRMMIPPCGSRGSRFVSMLRVHLAAPAASVAWMLPQMRVAVSKPCAKVM